MSTATNNINAAESTAPVSKRKCPVCGEAGTKVCGGCGEIGYCTKEHQREHWKIHKNTCAQKHKTAVTNTSNTNTQRPPEADIQVTWDDQQRINKFSRLNLQYQKLEDELKEKKTALANITDATGEIESLLDDDACKIKIGEVFIDVDNDEAESYVKKQKTSIQASTAAIQSQQETIKKEMDQLKTVLYAKFGKAINLENAEQTINN